MRRIGPTGQKTKTKAGTWIGPVGQKRITSKGMKNVHLGPQGKTRKSG